jgi:chitodextrinase
MTGPDTFGDTVDDHEQFETELLARDTDAGQVPTADIDEKTARYTVNELVEGGRVTPVPGDRVFVHEPSGSAFESIVQLAVFHWGWTAGLGTTEESE